VPFSGSIFPIFAITASLLHTKKLVDNTADFSLYGSVCAFCFSSVSSITKERLIFQIMSEKGIRKLFDLK